MSNPSRPWIAAAFGVVLLAASWVAGSAAERWDRGLAEDRVVYRALGYARATARLAEAGHGQRTPHLLAYGNAVGRDAHDVLRMVLVDLGKTDAFGVRRGARTLWALDGHVGPVKDVDRTVAARGIHLASLFEPGRKNRPIKLTELVEVARTEPGKLRVAAYAPVVVNGQARAVAAALLRVDAPVPETASAIWLLALTVVGFFCGALFLFPSTLRLTLWGALLALALACALWVPDRINAGAREQLADRAGDLLAIQELADTHGPVALAAPVANREVWSPDGALRLEREPAGESADKIAAGATRVGGPLASVHVHPDVAAELSRPWSNSVLVWCLLCALLMGLLVLPVARLMRNVVEAPGTYAYVAPAVIALLVLVFLPFVTGIGLAFYRYHLEGNAYEMIGFGNFAEIVAPDAASDIHFWRTLGVTLLWTSFNVVLHLAIGLSLALLLNRPALKGRAWYRVLLILPWAIPSYITALMWRFMFMGQAGPINSLLGGIGLEPVSWFDDHFWTNFIPNLVTNTWLGFPFMMVVALGALQSIPGDLYEAAELDGAGPWRRFVHVTLPLLKPALLPAVILGTIWTFNLFNVIYLVSMGAGHTEILITEAYRAFHEQHRHGYAAAYSVLIFMILLGYTLITARITRTDDEAIA